MKWSTIFFLIFILPTISFAQGNARNGDRISSSGNVSVFIVFADVVNDSNTDTVVGWPAGDLPVFADDIVSPFVSNMQQGFVSRYFEEMSFGNLKITGDYYPNLVEVNVNSGNGKDEVVAYLKALSGNDIITKNGLHLADFDQWQRSGHYGTKNNVPDDYIEILVVVWRHNSRYRRNRDGGNTWAFGHMNKQFKNKGIENLIFLCTNDVSEVLIHEISHLLIGGNNYHTGGAGTNSSGFFLANIGGYSMLSSYNRNIFFCNGFERWWLGWKKTGKNFYISAQGQNGNEEDSDLEYNNNTQLKEFVLRDFATYGDAVRIKLPYLKSISSDTRNQYLWIENHQVLSQSVEFHQITGNIMPQKGIRINYQIGNDFYEGTGDYLCHGSRANHFVPISSFGNYDFYYDTIGIPSGTTQSYRARTFRNLSNPFFGDHPIMLPAFDINGNDEITSDEDIHVWSIFRDNVLEFDHWPVFGNSYDVFPIGSQLSISSNPSLCPLINYSTKRRPLDSLYSTPQGDDNRYIWLNGLHIDVVEQYPDGSIKIRIIWNDYDVDKDVRWCGPIMLNENLYLKPFRNMILDYGLTPTRPNNPVFLNGRKVFSDPTTFTCRNGSYFKQEEGSMVNVKNNSTLVIEAGATYEINDRAVLNVEASGTLVVRSGATLRVKGAGHVEVKDGAYLCIESGANILLDDVLSMINLRPGSDIGINPAGSSGLTCNCALQGNIHVVGNGLVNNDFVDDLCIQNKVFSHDVYLSGDHIIGGYDVCIDPHGPVLVTNGARVIFDGENGTYLKNGFRVDLGSSLEVR